MAHSFNDFSKNSISNNIYGEAVVEIANGRNNLTTSVDFELNNLRSNSTPAEHCCNKII